MSTGRPKTVLNGFMAARNDFILFARLALRLAKTRRRLKNCEIMSNLTLDIQYEREFTHTHKKKKKATFAVQ